MIKAVIFDFFGVLVTEGFKQFLETYLPEMDRRDHAVKLVNQVDSGKITMRQFSEQLASLANVEVSKIADELGGNKPNRLLIEFIRNHLKNNYKISILSNSSMDFPRKILDSKDIKLFDDIVLSYRFGVVKPDPQIYNIAAERLGVGARECIFIDDSVGHITGAQAVGMKGIHYQDFNQMKQELKSLLKGKDSPSDGFIPRPAR